MADNIKYRFIQNVGDYFPAGYFGEDFIDRVQKLSCYSNDEVEHVCSRYRQLRRYYDDYKNDLVSQSLRPKDSIFRTHEFHTRLLRELGYDGLTAPYSEHYIIDEEHQELIPVRHILRRGHQVQMLVMEMRPLIKVGDTEAPGLFEQQYDDEQPANKASRFTASHWERVFPMPQGYRISPAIVNKAISRIFLMPDEQRPKYILMLAGNTLFLFEQEKWSRGSYLTFTLDDLFSQASIRTYSKYYALFHMLLCHESLAPESDTVLMDAIVEDSYKNAYEVTKDLKEGVVLAVETLANEALWYMKHNGLPFGKYIPEEDRYDETDDRFEAEVKDDCLQMVYRLLFLFYAESRPELEIIPVGDEVYDHGYSLEMLRDLEQVRLVSEESRSGYFFDASLKRLFSLLASGHKEHQHKTELDRSFRVRHIDSPLFDDSKLHHLAPVRFRNEKWQQIICALSLSKKQRGRGRGRISYANLGINQLGSVYESLLAYRGFYAEEDYIEVHKAGKPEEGTFLVPYSRLDSGNFDISTEVICEDDGSPRRLPKGTFVYRLNGRDRQKSASYYTPEILTKSTVKYTLKGILERVEKNIEEYRQLKEQGLAPSDNDWRSGALELLNLKILEPAMGAAAFQNEVINQVAEAYLKYRQQERQAMGHTQWRIEPDHYRDELQKVKAYIATHNVYGVDLNPTAIELGKLSLWLNVIHKEMTTPFFSNRLAVGNAVIGAWLKTYHRSDVLGRQGKKRRGRYGTELEANPYWEKAPKKVSFSANRPKHTELEVYHFLLPDPAMLAVRGIREMRDAHRDDYDAMALRISDWKRPVYAHDFEVLQRLTRKIDVLLHDYLEFQLNIERLTDNRAQLWGTPGGAEYDLHLVDSYAEKEQLNDTRYRHNNPYYKLRMIMDYWCALWFWEYDDATKIPTREEYWADIEAMLDVDDSRIERRAKAAMHVDAAEQTNLTANDAGEPDLFRQEEQASSVAEDEVEPSDEVQSEEEALKIAKSKEEFLQQVTSQAPAQLGLIADRRFEVVARLAQRYHFFHPMLEFLEVFWLRDGFDIICGNPPWLKLQFNDQSIISDKYPEIAIRKVAAPAVRSIIDKFMQNDLLKELYESEQIEIECSSSFMNACQNYPLLLGQQTNLYKCVLTNSFELINEKGFLGLLHPDGVYDDSNGQILRKEIYHRLKYHFQYVNTLKLFSEILHWVKFSSSIYSKHQENIEFDSISNLYHPSTIDASYVHDGHGVCQGLKDADDNWNITPHKDRIVKLSQEDLKILADTFEDGVEAESAKLVCIHANSILNVIKKIGKYPSHVSDYDLKISAGFHETSAVDEGIIIPKTVHANPDCYGMIFKGPQFTIGNPWYKTPRSSCKNQHDYEVVNLGEIEEGYYSRTNFVPGRDTEEYKSIIPGFEIGKDKEGNPIYDNWIDYYKLAFRSQLSQPQERTLICAVLPRKTAHINAVISVAFCNLNHCVDMAALCSSLVLDFYIKTTGAGGLFPSRMMSFPLGIADKYKPALFARTLLLNCLTTAYADLWAEMWNPAYCDETWSIDDARLKPFSTLTPQWEWATPLRNYFERRQALVEIDVIAAMALGLTLQDLEMIYTIQFPVLQQNENDTWYDAEGKIVFTCSKGLTGVGLDRKRTGRNGAPGWEDIRGEQLDENTYAGLAPTHTHTIDPKKSELYGGQQQTFIAPYTRCDRIADYRRAWAHFEKIFNK